MNQKNNISAVIATLGDRSLELEKAIQSLINQTSPPLEIVIVDQNKEYILNDIVKKFQSMISIKHIRTIDDFNVQTLGLSWARNIGLNYVNGDYVIFPDDDCWYPENFLVDLLDTMSDKKVDFVSGRAADEKTLKSINASFFKKSQYINRYNAWFTSIEWVVLFKKEMLVSMDGYNEELGVGAPTKWNAAEGQDLIIRCIDSGYKGYFNFNIYGHHPIVSLNPKDKNNVRKLISYARGTGRVFRINNYKIFAILMCIRPLIKIPLYILKLDFSNVKARIYISYANFEGYFSSINEK
tara:strand:- start:378 stop:1265 length:888 start_codon:yes stop_codon:yes gene_type:complete